MNVAILIIDSLSFRATPFSHHGANTMPELSELVDEYGSIIYTKAFAPGPASPSSHSSILTNQLPSSTGMHEASPTFSRDIITLPEYLSNHNSLILSSNPFLFTGLEQPFDKKINLSHKRDDEAIHTDPEQSQYQIASEVNDHLLDFVKTHSSPQFLFVNFMDVHPPYVPSQEAVNKFSTINKSKLPIGVSGHRLYSNYVKNQNETNKIETLYNSTIFDFDKKFSDIVEHLLQEDFCVLITADHGNWVWGPLSLINPIIHVPLLLMTPSRSNVHWVDYTVNIRHIPSTVGDILDLNSFPHGDSLLSVSSHRTSISESVHKKDAERPVETKERIQRSELQYDISAIRGNGRIDHVNDKTIKKSGGKITKKSLKSTIESLTDRDPKINSKMNKPDRQVIERLEDLGYR